MAQSSKIKQWTWPQLLSVYKNYGDLMTEYLEIAKRLGFMLPLQREVARLSKMHPDRAEIVSRTFLHVTRINTHLLTLEREIERRSALVGVWG